MKGLCIVLLTCAICLSSLPDGLSAQGAIFYLYGDEDHLQICDLDADGSTVVVYVWVRNTILNGFRCVEFGNIEISDAMDNYVWELARDYNPDLMQPIMNTSSGLSACFPACRTDEWTWIYKQPFWIETNEGFYMSIGPYEMSPYPKILDCDYVEHEMYLSNYYAVNQCATMEIECQCRCRPPEITYVTVEDESHFILSFDCVTAEATMTSIDNYSLYMKDDTSSTVQIEAIFDECYYGGPCNYHFTLDEPLMPMTTYTLRVDYIDGYLDDENGDEIDFSYTPVATLLQEFGAVLKGGRIELSWSMASVDEAIEFAVSRRAGGGEWMELPAGGIERADLSFTYLDDGVEPDESYVYRVEYETEGSRVLLFQTEAVEMPAMPLSLEQNVPNPFNPVTEIRCYLPMSVEVRLEIYDITGRLVRTLADGPQAKGWQTARWDGSDTGGRSVASGVYFYRLRAGKEIVSKKMVLLR